MFSYLDAGTGSMIVTAIAGGVAGIGVAAKMGMQRFKAKFTGKGGQEPDAGESTNGDSSSND